MYDACARARRHSRAHTLVDALARVSDEVAAVAAAAAVVAAAATQRGEEMNLKKSAASFVSSRC